MCAGMRAGMRMFMCADMREARVQTCVANMGVDMCAGVCVCDDGVDACADMCVKMRANMRVGIYTQTRA